jgi:hypothetical protein
MRRISNLLEKPATLGWFVSAFYASHQPTFRNGSTTCGSAATAHSTGREQHVTMGYLLPHYFQGSNAPVNGSGQFLDTYFSDVDLGCEALADQWHRHSKVGASVIHEPRWRWDTTGVWRQ